MKPYLASRQTGSFFQRDSSGRLQAIPIENEELLSVHVLVNITSVVEGLILQWLFKFMGTCLQCLGQSFDLLTRSILSTTVLTY